MGLFSFLGLDASMLGRNFFTVLAAVSAVASGAVALDSNQDLQRERDLAHDLLTLLNEEISSASQLAATTPSTNLGSASVDSLANLRQAAEHLRVATAAWANHDYDGMEQELERAFQLLGRAQQITIRIDELEDKLLPILQVRTSSAVLAGTAGGSAFLAGLFGANTRVTGQGLMAKAAQAMGMKPAAR